MNKKGVLGLDTAKAFIIAILIVVVLGFALIIVMGTLGYTTAGRISKTIYLSNETTTDVNVSGLTLAGSLLPNTNNDVCALEVVSNGTAGEIISSGNYTFTAVTCNLKSLTTTDLDYQNVSWLATYSVTYDSDAEVQSITRNITGGVTDFFSNASTWFSLLAVVIIILVIAIVIIAVNRFGGGAGGSGTSGESDGMIG